MKFDAQKMSIAMARSCLSISDLCIKTGLPRVTVSQAMRGLRNPKPKTIGLIAAGLGVDVTEIIEQEA